MSTSRSLSFSIAAIFWLLVIGGTISSHAQTRAYVVNFDGAVTVFDTETNAVVDTITLCPMFTCTPIISAATPNGTRLYVTNNLLDTVWVIDTLSNTVIDTFKVGQNPWGVAITPDGTRAYVANTDATISVIDTSTNRAIDTIIDLDTPIGVAITPDGTRAYFANGAGTVSVVDTSTNTVIDTIPVLDRFGLPAFNLASIVITPDGTRAYVVSNNTGQIDVIDTTTNAVITTIPPLMEFPLGGGNLSIAINSDGTRVYSASRFLPAVVVDTSSNTIIATIPVNGSTPFVGVTPDDTKLYVAAGSGVSIFDTSTLALITRVELDRQIGGIAFATLPEVPHSKDDCKDGGFQHFSALAFTNQGQCVKFVNEHAN